MATQKYAYLLEEIEGELNTIKEKKVKESLEARLKVIDRLKEATADLEKEVRQLLKNGKITDLSTVIKVVAGEEDNASAPIVISPNSANVGRNTTGIRIDA